MSFIAYLESGAASILQMALGRVGGLLEGKKNRQLGRSLLCADRPAYVLRAGLGDGGYPA